MLLLLLQILVTFQIYYFFFCQVLLETCYRIKILNQLSYCILAYLLIIQVLNSLNILIWAAKICCLNSNGLQRKLVCYSLQRVCYWLLSIANKKRCDRKISSNNRKSSPFLGFNSKIQYAYTDDFLEIFIFIKKLRSYHYIAGFLTIFWYAASSCFWYTIGPSLTLFQYYAVSLGFSYIAYCTDTCCIFVQMKRPCTKQKWCII